MIRFHARTEVGNGFQPVIVKFRIADEFRITVQMIGATESAENRERAGKFPDPCKNVHDSIARKLAVKKILRAMKNKRTVF